jgi:hypothetical protein
MYPAASMNATAKIGLTNHQMQSHKKPSIQTIGDNASAPHSIQDKQLPATIQTKRQVIGLRFKYHSERPDPLRNGALNRE